MPRWCSRTFSQQSQTTNARGLRGNGIAVKAIMAMRFSSRVLTTAAGNATPLPARANAVDSVFTVCLPARYQRLFVTAHRSGGNHHPFRLVSPPGDGGGLFGGGIGTGKADISAR